MSQMPEDNKKKIPDSVLRFKQKQKTFNNKIINNSSVFEDHTNDDKTFKKLENNNFTKNNYQSDSQSRHFSNYKQQFNNTQQKFNNTQQHFNNTQQQFNNTQQQRQYTNNQKQFGKGERRYGKGERRYGKGQKSNSYQKINLVNEDKWCSTNNNVQNDTKNLNTENFPSLGNNSKNNEFKNDKWKNIESIKNDKGISQLWDQEKKNALLKKELKDQKTQDIYEKRELRKLKIKQENIYHGDEFYDDDDDDDDDYDEMFDEDL